MKPLLFLGNTKSKLIIKHQLKMETLASVSMNTSFSRLDKNQSLAADLKLLKHSEIEMSKFFYQR